METLRAKEKTARLSHQNIADETGLSKSAVQVVLFLRERRLLSLIVAHMRVNAISALSGYLAQG